MTPVVFIVAPITACIVVIFMAQPSTELATEIGLTMLTLVSVFGTKKIWSFFAFKSQKQAEVNTRGTKVKFFLQSTSDRLKDSNFLF